MIYMTFFQDLHNTENRIFKFNGMNTFPPLGHWWMNIQAAKTNQEGLKALPYKNNHKQNPYKLKSTIRGKISFHLPLEIMYTLKWRTAWAAEWFFQKPKALQTPLQSQLQ